MTNILKQIVEEKKETLNLIKRNNSIDSLEKKIKDLNFQVFRRYPELDQTGRSFIIRQLKKQIGGLKKVMFI